MKKRLLQKWQNRKNKENKTCKIRIIFLSQKTIPWNLTHKMHRMQKSGQFCLRKISCESGFNLVDFLCNADSCKLAGASSIRNNSDYWWNSFRFGSVGSISLYHCVDCVWYGAGCTGQGKDVASDWEVSPDWITGNRVCCVIANSCQQ